MSRAAEACPACLALAAEPPAGPPAWSICGCRAGYPAQLLDLGERAPAVLFGLGERSALEGLDPDATVTIVGSRRATPYGLDVARSLARMLAGAGITIVSGMAFGIDAAAHEGALDGEGRTLAVLAGGPDVPYPASKRALHRRILATGGAVVAERAPGTRPEKWGFPARNRIMAALAGMTVVVEAAEPSGSLITAREAIDLHRNVGAVPGPITARVSAGTHGLIRDGAALIRDAQDVLDEMLGVGQTRVEAFGPRLDADLDAALRLVEAGNDTVDLLAGASGGEPRACAVAMARLELLGYVSGSASGTYARTALAVPP